MGQGLADELLIPSRLYRAHAQSPTDCPKVVSRNLVTGGWKETVDVKGDAAQLYLCEAGCPANGWNDRWTERM